MAGYDLDAPLCTLEQLHAARKVPSELEMFKAYNMYNSMKY